MTKRILLIEDSPTQAEKTRLMLEEEGYSVEIAFDGSEGINKTANFQPDLIVLDVYLPKLSGFEVCKRLKSDVNVRSTPVVMFSHDKKLTNMTLAYSQGADYYVVKNEEGEQILSHLIKSLFARRSYRMTRPLREIA